MSRLRFHNLVSLGRVIKQYIAPTATTDLILMETGDQLLLESGDSILI